MEATWGCSCSPTSDESSGCPLAVLLLAVPAAIHDTAPAEAAPQVDAGFGMQTVFSGLTLPTVVRFSPDGRVFVAEKSGLVKVFDSMSDTTATTAIDIRT